MNQDQQTEAEKPPEPVSVIEAICGEVKDWDELDALSFQFYNCPKFNGNTVAIHFDAGVVEVYEKETEDLLQVFNINVTLTEVPQT